MRTSAEDLLYSSGRASRDGRRREETVRLLASLREDIARVDDRLRLTEAGWFQGLQGQNAHQTPPTPMDGRLGPYPGVPAVSHPDKDWVRTHTAAEVRDNEMHFQWTLMVIWMMSRPGVDFSVSRLADQVGIHDATLKKMLDGRAYGRGDNRRLVTWVLCRELLRAGMSFEVLVVKLEQWGDWGPPGVARPFFHLEGGEARCQRRARRRPSVKNELRAI